MNYLKKRCIIKKELLIELVDDEKLDAEYVYKQIARALEIPKIFFYPYEDGELQENDFKRRRTN